MARRILIIGGTRFVGRLFVLRALARGDRLTLFNRGSHADPFGDRVERLVGDRTTDAFDRALAGRRFDATIDFAAYVAPDVQRVLDVLGDGVGRYVLISTGQVYLVREGAPMPAREEDYFGPTMARPEGVDDLREWEYGMGKRACEDLLAGVPSIRLRIPMVNGPGDFHRRIERYVHRMLDGGPILVPDAGRRVRHVDATEVAATIDALLDRQAEGAFNQAQDETPTLRELLEAIGREVGTSPRIVEVQDLASRVDLRAVSPFSGAWMSFLDPSRIRSFGIGHAPLAVTLARAVGGLLAALPKAPDDYFAERPKELSSAT